MQSTASSTGGALTFGDSIVGATGESDIARMGAMGKITQLTFGIGGAGGIMLALLGKLFPKFEPYIPSPTGFGIAFVILFFSSLPLFLGALIALIIEKRSASALRLDRGRIVNGYRSRLAAGWQIDLIRDWAK
jgi:hypothetical protein